MEPEEYELIAAVEQSHWWYRGLRNHVLAKINARLEQGGYVLDAGCGTGGTVAALNGRFPSAKILGIDSSPFAVQHAKATAGGHLAFGNVHSLPFPDDLFDYIISLDVLYHAAVDEKQALREFLRTVKPGGLVLVQVPAYDWLWSDHDVVVHTARRYTAGKLRSSAVGAGFGVVECGYRNSLLFPLMVAQRLMSKVFRSDTPRSAVVRHGVIINSLLGAILGVENMLLGRGVRFPVGGSVFAVFRRPS